MRRTVTDGDSGEEVEVGAQTHCFIVRLNDDLFARVLEYQRALQGRTNVKVSRAEAMREIAAQVLPRRRRCRTNERQVELFGKPLVAIEAQKVASAAAERLIK